MRLIRAEFVRRQPPERVLWAMLALVALAALALGLAAWRKHVVVIDLLERVERLNREADADARRSRSPLQTTPLPYDSSAREMLRERQVPWPLVLTALETVSLRGATPSSLDLDARRAAASLEVTFSDHEGLLDFVDALNAGLPDGAAAWRWRLASAQLADGGRGVAVLHSTWSER